MNDRTLDQSMRDLITAQLVTEESAEQFSFRHALTHEAVYHTLLVRERRRIHHLVAETVERLFAATLDVYAAELAHHYFEAGTWQKALIYSRQAGERARQMYAPREAAAYFTRALESARQLAAEGVPGLPAR